MQKRITTIEDLAILVQREFAEIDKKFLAMARRMDGFITKEDAKHFATKEDLRGFATKDDLKRFATKDDLKHLATKDDLKRFATKDDLRESVEILRGEIRNIDMRTPMIDLQGRMKKSEDRLDAAGI